MRLPRLTLLFVLSFLFLAAASGEVVISEFLASNDDGLKDEDGEFSDWIELENTGPATVNLEGWSLTDDVTRPQRWIFPPVELGPGQRLIVFATGKDRRNPSTPLHTNFSLSAAGEYLALIKPDGTTIASAYTPTYPPQRENVSYGRGRRINTLPLVTPTQPARWHLPSPNDPHDGGWQQPDYDDSHWSIGQTAIGYQTEPAVAPAETPIAYWRLEGSAADSSGFDQETIHHQVSFPQGTPPGVAGIRVAQFNGSSSYISSEVDVSETAYTISLWFKTNQASVGLFSVVDRDLGENHNRHLYLTNGNLAARIWNNEVIRTNGLNLADGQWHHVAHVYGPSVGGQRLYVDGVLAASGTKSRSDFDWQQRVNIGYSADASRPYFAGQMDEIAIWNQALNTAQIQALARGASPLALDGVTGFLHTNTQAMYGQTPSAWLRVSFDAPRHEEFTHLELRIRYDDGFVAWLNSEEVARRNAPSSLAWNSGATTNRPLADVVNVETIDLSAYLPLLKNEGNLLAIHALNDSASSPEFLFSPELAGLIVTSSDARFFLQPSPQAPNDEGVAGFVEAAQFTPGRGHYTSPITVTLTTATPGATLVYTTNGTEPTLTNGIQVPAPDEVTPPLAQVSITTTTNLRAAVFKDDYAAASPVTHSYIFPAAVARQSNHQLGLPTVWEGIPADYEVDPDVVNTTLPGYSFEEALASLPTMVLTGDPAGFFSPQSGIYYHPNNRGMAWERKVSVEYFLPDGTNAFQVHAGARLHGNSSRQHSFTPKHPIRLTFRKRYGLGQLRFPLFSQPGADRIDQLILRAASTDSFPVVDGPPRWINDKATYQRDQFVRDTLIELGHPNARGTYVHLFINHLYWGLYTPPERPIDAFNANHFGGKKEDYDVIKDFAEVDSGDRTAWDATMAAAAAGLTSNEAYQKFLGNNPDGTRNPTYPVHLHLPSFIDYMIVHIAGGAEDWPNHNWWAARRRGPDSEGWRFFAWDQEICFDDLVRTRSVIFPQQPFESVNAPNSPAFLYDKLRRNPTFQQLFRDRVHELFFNSGPLSPEQNRARWARRTAEIDRAIVAESARWGDAREHPPIKRETKWLAEQEWMQKPGGFWDQNHERALQRFRNVGLYPSIDAPILIPPSGPISTSTPILFRSDHPVYYTLDGSDPRAPDGSISPSARLFEGTTQAKTWVPKKAVWRYRDDGLITGTAWRLLDFDDRDWLIGPGELGYGDGDEDTVISYGPDLSNRYVTYWFRHEFIVSDPVLSATLRLLCDDGAAVYLNGAEVVRHQLPGGELTPETLATHNVAGDDEKTYTPFSIDPSHLVQGRNVLAVELHQVSPQSSDLSFDLELSGTVQAVSFPLLLHTATTVTTRAKQGEEWSGRTIGVYTITSPETYESWRSTAFDPTAPDYALTSAPAADPDHDGLPNFMEYLLATPPLEGQHEPLQIATSASGIFVSFRRRQNHPNVIYHLESSSDLTRWDLINSTSTISEPAADGTVLETRHITPSLSSPYFFRLRGEFQPN